MIAGGRARDGEVVCRLQVHSEVLGQILDPQPPIRESAVRIWRGRKTSSQPVKIPRVRQAVAEDDDLAERGCFAAVTNGAANIPTTARLRAVPSFNLFIMVWGIVFIVVSAAFFVVGVQRKIWSSPVLSERNR